MKKSSKKNIKETKINKYALIDVELHLIFRKGIRIIFIVTLERVGIEFEPSAAIRSRESME